ncbi:unnamed protein product, partial [Tuber aestivum]
MPFLALPNEIVLQISKFQSPPDLNSLLKTSRRFAALLKPELIDAACCAAYSNYGKRAILELLLKNRRVMVDSCDLNRRTALGVAAESGNEKIVELLLDAGADVDWVDECGLTPLLVASGEGHDRIVQLLLYNDANINWADHGGRTSLHIAAAYGHEGVVKVLL